MNAAGTWNTRSLRMAQRLLGEDVISNEQIDATNTYTSDKDFESIMKTAEKKILTDLDKAMNPETYMTTTEKTKIKEAQEAEKLKLQKESLNAQRQNTAAVNALTEAQSKDKTTQERTEVISKGLAEVFGIPF